MKNKIKRRPLIVGNWKMNGLLQSGLALTGYIKGAVGTGEGIDKDVLICPPATLLISISGEIIGSPLMLGAQGCHYEEHGAYTGDLSPSMLADAGCSHIILGHSERRAEHGETNEGIAMRAHAAHEAGLVPIICIGESEEEHDRGIAMQVIEQQIRSSLPSLVTAENTVIAYEPVWAIGTGHPASPEEAENMHMHVRAIIAETRGQEVADGIRVLYGGSMKPDNAAHLLACPNIDGGLIGGVSLNGEDFMEIVQCIVD